MVAGALSGVGRLTPEGLYLGVTVAMSELLLSGCTTTTDHHYLFPAGLEDAVDIEVAAAKRLGMRVLLTRGSMNRSERDGGSPLREQIHNCRALDYLEQCGWLNARTWLAHGIFFNAEEMRRLGKAKTTVSHATAPAATRSWRLAAARSARWRRRA